MVTSSDSTQRLPLTPTARDIAEAESTDERIRLRQQATRRHLTYIVMVTTCVAILYLIGRGDKELQLMAFGALTALGASISGFYFNTRQPPSPAEKP